MNLDHHDLERLSGQTGFRAATLEKVIRLGELLADITTHPYLGPRLVLKGGTALHLCPGPPPRLSVDLDFNYVGVLERDTMLAERPEVERALLVLARSSAYQVQHSREAFAGRKFFLDYHGAFGVRDRMEVDLNFLSRLPVLETARATFWQPGDLPRAEARVLNVEETVRGQALRPAGAQRSPRPVRRSALARAGGRGLDFATIPLALRGARGRARAPAAPLRPGPARTQRGARVRGPVASHADDG